MDNAFQYMDIIFLAVVAGVVLLRLRSVLGKRTGSEKKDPNLYSYDKPVNQSTDTPKPVQMQANINNSKPDWFDNDNFIAGAKGAYEAIVTNFENDNIKELKPLLEEDVLKSFTEVIEKRKREW
jgi:predicted lipid-binding transport protein (Tim44 family)